MGSMRTLSYYYALFFAGVLAILVSCGHSISDHQSITSLSSKAKSDTLESNELTFDPQRLPNPISIRDDIPYSPDGGIAATALPKTASYFEKDGLSCPSYHLVYNLGPDQYQPEYYDETGTLVFSPHVENGVCTDFSYKMFRLHVTNPRIPPTITLDWYYSMNHAKYATPWVAGDYYEKCSIGVFNQGAGWEWYDTPSTDVLNLGSWQYYLDDNSDLYIVFVVTSNVTNTFTTIESDYHLIKLNTVSLGSVEYRAVGYESYVAGRNKLPYLAIGCASPPESVDLSADLSVPPLQIWGTCGIHAKIDGCLGCELKQIYGQDWDLNQLRFRPSVRYVHVQNHYLNGAAIDGTTFIMYDPQDMEFLMNYGTVTEGIVSNLYPEDFIDSLGNVDFEAYSRAYFTRDWTTAVDNTSNLIDVEDYWYLPYKPVITTPLEQGDLDVNQETLRSIKLTLASKRAVWCAANWYFTSNNYDQGWPGQPPFENYMRNTNPLHHAMCIVGYDDHFYFNPVTGVYQGAVKVRNSLGSNWPVLRDENGTEIYTGDGHIWVSYDAILSGRLLGFLILSEQYNRETERTYLGEENLSPMPPPERFYTTQGLYGSCVELTWDVYPECESYTIFKDDVNTQLATIVVPQGTQRAKYDDYSVQNDRAHIYWICGRYGADNSTLGDISRPMYGWTSAANQ